MEVDQCPNCGCSAKEKMEHKEGRISPPANINSFSRALLYEINNLVG
jgi:hypothetical protein